VISHDENRMRTAVKCSGAITLSPTTILMQK